ncbi:unnamed protein product [Caenorhabditis angaria]|uniref:Uncharacterized protein n=1 Tax=Caenorhabditis angaria TaxID=860376 RepID=A0A9P1I3G7_9PELO|nr:unnamed protein product [Caenorhabditis angaria]
MYDFTDSLISVASLSVICLLLIFTISLVIILPIYRKIYKINHERDCVVPVYPITNHFYKSIIFLAFFISIGIPILIIGCIYAKEYSVTALFMVLYILVAYFITVIITTVQNFLIFAISLQSKIFSKLIKWFYFIIIVENIFVRGFKVSCLLKTINNETNLTLNDDYIECSEIYDLYYMGSYIFSDVLVFIASILYLIMMRHVRKIRKRTEDHIKTRPERYLLYQTLLIFLTRMFAFPLIAIVIMTNSLTADVLFFIFMLTDITTTPFIIQVSYLVCNKDQTKTFVWTEIRKFSWICDCLKICSQDNSVPDIRLDNIENEENTNNTTVA